MQQRSEVRRVRLMRRTVDQLIVPSKESAPRKSLYAIHTHLSERCDVPDHVAVTVREAGLASIVRWADFTPHGLESGVLGGKVSHGMGVTSCTVYFGRINQIPVA